MFSWCCWNDRRYSRRYSSDMTVDEMFDASHHYTRMKQTHAVIQNGAQSRHQRSRLPIVFCWFIGGWSVPWGSCVPVQRAGAAPAEGRPSNSRGGTLTWRGGAESRAGISRYNFKNIYIIFSLAFVKVVLRREGLARRSAWENRGRPRNIERNDEVSKSREDLLDERPLRGRRKRPKVKVYAVWRAQIYAQKTRCRRPSSLGERAALWLQRLGDGIFLGVARTRHRGRRTLGRTRVYLPDLPSTIASVQEAIFPFAARLYDLAKTRCLTLFARARARAWLILELCAYVNQDI